MTAANLKAYPPSGATRDVAPARAPLTIDLDVDVCVIGGGVAGLTAARELARRGSSVAVLEAERIPWCATDRSAGLVLPGFPEDIERIVDRVGLQQGKELWALAASGMEQVRRAVCESMPGIHPLNGHIALTRRRDERLRERATFLREQFGANVEFWPTRDVHGALPGSRYFQALHYPDAFRLNPLAYVHGLAAAAERAGARIYEDTPARQVDAEGVRKRVNTASARVRAGRIVLADGTQAAKLFPLLGDTIIALHTFAVATAPLGEGLSSALPFRGSVAEVGGDAVYYALDGERLLWTGRVTMRAHDPQRMAGRLRGDIARTFPQLRAVEIAHAWSARSTYAVHRMPQIGEVKAGLWLADAFGRQSLATNTMAGLLIAGAIVEGDDRWRLFSSYGLCANGGWAARALLEAGLRTQRAHNRFDDFLARYRPASTIEAELPAHSEAPTIVPADEAFATPPAPEPELESAIEEVAAPAAAAPMPKPARPKRVRKAAPRADRTAKAKRKATSRSPAEAILVRKTATRRTKPKAVRPVAPELPAPSAVTTDAPDGAST